VARPAALALLGAGAVAAPTPARAQPDCYPSPTSNEARALALSSLPLVFSGARAPRADGAPVVEVGLEVTYLPRVRDAIATPTICRPGKGPEHTELLPAFPRPRLLLRLPAALVLEASWVPPVRVAQVRSNLLGVALAHERPLRGTLALRVRAHATVGSVEAPITCPDEALDDAASECFAGERSNDRLRPNLAGAELALGWSVAGGRLRPYAGAGYTWLRPRFRVNFRNRVGEVDRSRVEVDLERVPLFGGATWRAAERVAVSGEVYGTSQDGATARVLVTAGVPWAPRD
jgi:hypothetical protein